MREARKDCWRNRGRKYRNKNNWLYCLLQASVSQRLKNYGFPQPVSINQPDSIVRRVRCFLIISHNMIVRAHS